MKAIARELLKSLPADPINIFLSLLPLVAARSAKKIAQWEFILNSRPAIQNPTTKLHNESVPFSKTHSRKAHSHEIQIFMRITS